MKQLVRRIGSHCIYQSSWQHHRSDPAGLSTVKKQCAAQHSTAVARNTAVARCNYGSIHPPFWASGSTKHTHLVLTLQLSLHISNCRYLQEIGVDAELVNLDLKERQHKTADFMKVGVSKVQGGFSKSRSKQCT